MATDLPMVDRFLWNEHTDLMLTIEPSIEDKYPHVWRWFEIRDHEVAMLFRTVGASVFHKDGFFWLGCPRDQHFADFFNELVNKACVV
jgi:hypothetical protein